LKCEGHLLNAGKTLAFTKVDIYSAKTDKLVATGTHTKFIGNALKNDHGKNLTFDVRNLYYLIEAQLSWLDRTEEKM